MKLIVIVLVALSRGGGERERTKVFAGLFHVMLLICEKIPTDGGAMLQEMNQLLLFLYK